MIKESSCVNKFLDWLSSNCFRWDCLNSISAVTIAQDYYAVNSSEISLIDELSGGCTNSSCMIRFLDGREIKLTVFNELNSLYRVKDRDQFFAERSIKNSMYKDEFRILFNADPRITVSEFLNGDSIKDLLNSIKKPIGIYSKSFLDLNQGVVDSIADFHKQEIKTHCTTISSIAKFFCDSLDNVVAVNDFCLKLCKRIRKGIGEISEFESKFDERSFVLSHFDTDPVNLLYSDNKVELIDFEFAGVGLEYYDFVNYLNVLDSFYINSAVGRKCFKEEFVKMCQNRISNFNLLDFNKSYVIMRFVWGIWYILYGLRNDLGDYLEIGVNWISDWLFICEI